MKSQLVISIFMNRDLQNGCSLTGLLSLKIGVISATIVVPLDNDPLDGDRNDTVDFDSRWIVREIDILLDMYGIAGGSNNAD
jgi:hypothetical protein